MRGKAEINHDAIDDIVQAYIRYILRIDICLFNNIFYSLLIDTASSKISTFCWTLIFSFVHEDIQKVWDQSFRNILCLLLKFLCIVATRHWLKAPEEGYAF